MKTLALTIPTLFLLPLAASAHDDHKEIPYGIEIVTSYKSEYVYRGLDFSNEALDVQLSTEISLGADQFIGITAWYTTAVSDGDFDQAGLKIAYIREFEDFTYELGVVGHSTSHEEFDSGVEGLTSLSYHFNENTSVNALLTYDTGAEGFYSALSFKHFEDLNEDSFLTFRAGLSFVSDYYERDGVNDVFARLAYTYNINNYVAVTPYVGTSIQLIDDNSDVVYGGLSFEVSF